MKYRCGILFFLLACVTLSPAQAQWWGADSLPGNADQYTYRTRFGHWQFGGGLRNAATPQAYADRGIIRNWQDGMPIAVDRNISGGRFAQPGVPNLVYVPRIDYFDDLGYLTDFHFREGLRQYWPEDGRLLIDEWEQVAYEPDRASPARSSAGTSSATTSNRVSQPLVIVAQPQQRRQQTQAIVVRQVPLKQQPEKLTYHQQIMRQHAERRAEEEARVQQQNEQMQLARHAQIAQLTQQNHAAQQRPDGESLWFRDAAPGQPRNVLPVGTTYGTPVSTYALPTDPVLELEKRLEYSLAGSYEVSFFSPLQVKFQRGEVTVTGTVGSEQEKQAAERILLTQPEVQRVQNRLNVAE